MWIFTADKNGNPGHPTRRFAMIRKLRKRGRVRIIGGGASGKPPVAIFLDREFDYSKTVNRKLVIALDPGYRYIGFAVCEPKDGRLTVYGKGILETRIPDIKGLMTERRGYRRFRRYCSRYRKRRMSKKQGRNLAKYKAPRNVRSRDKSNATLKHGVETHLNLFARLLKYFPFPKQQISYVVEDNVFDVRTMTWGKTYGKGYQKSPRTEAEKRCIICGTTEGLHRHHIIQRRYGGTDVAENLVYLCRDCHKDVHEGRIYIPIKGIKQWRALGTMNAIIGRLRNIPWLEFIPADIVARLRRNCGFTKGHGNDALATAAAYCGAEEIDAAQSIELRLVKIRRHSRARIHALRDRLYKVDGKIIARNRKKKTDQKEPSFADISPVPPEVQAKMKVYPGKKMLNPKRNEIPTIAGDIWFHLPTDKRFVALGVISGDYIYSPELEGITGKSYIHPTQCRHVIKNEGIVVREYRLSSPD